MDEWHRKLARDLVARTPAVTPDERATALEVAFGDARAAVAFTLEFARAHRIVATGNVAGDDLWIQLGEARARFTLNRREARVIVRARGDEKHLQWDDARNAIVDATGTLADLQAAARSTLDAIVSEWRSSPTVALLSSVPPQPDPEHDDEPTKG